MGFLAPLYLIGGLAIALPIIFHLIRRQPRGRQVFSSLMFLTPSPPRLVRRNRLDNILLLILRGLVLTLLALAFMRPFWRSALDTDQELPARKRIILVDTSASMQRETLWRQALQKIEDVLNDVGPRDSVALYAFDASVRPLVSLDDASQLAAPERVRTLRMAVEKLKPTWNGTDLGLALMTAADLLHSTAEDPVEGKNPSDVSSKGEIVLISDLQSGSQIHLLEGFQWPEDIRVDVRAVRANDTSNARAVLLSGTEEETPENATTSDLRVRVSNSISSKSDRLKLRWLDETGKPLSDQPQAAQVPPGEVRVIRFADVPQQATQLVLDGDAQAFDNILYFAQREKHKRNLLFVGQQNTHVSDSLAYFLARLPLENAERTVATVFRAPGDPSPWPDVSETPLIILGREATLEDAQSMRGYLASGGHALWVLERPVGAGNVSTESIAIRALTGDADLTISEAAVRDYAMIQQVSFSHPLFISLDNPKYNDFTKIRFWRHRKVEFGTEDDWRVLARFDDGSPALSERTIDQGKLWLLASGWQASESQFAMSSKFVALIGGMFALAEPSNPWSATVQVGDSVTLNTNSTNVATTGAIGTTGAATTARLIDSRGTELLPEGNADRVEIKEPGLYTIATDDRSVRLAANIAIDESNTEPMDLARLEQLGVATGRATTLVELKANKRQMQAVELESRQQWWRWLIVIALVVVAGESLLAARATRFSGVPT